MALTEKKKKFAANIAVGMTATDAARAAGFVYSSPASLRVTASRLQQQPEVRQAAFLERERLLNGPLASRAIKTLSDVMEDATAPPAARIQAARFILESAGHGVVNKQLAARHPEDAEKALANLSIAELEEIVTRQELGLKLAPGRVMEISGQDETTTDDAC